MKNKIENRYSAVLLKDNQVTSSYQLYKCDCFESKINGDENVSIDFNKDTNGIIGRIKTDVELDL